MKDIKVKDIIDICKGKLICGDEEIVCQNFSKDTRTVVNGDVYVGIKGENFDGNTLYKEALEKGASVAIIEKIEPEKIEGKTIIVVENTIKALQEIASYKRSLYNIPVIAVTGSVGKTSTKDIIASVMSTRYKVLKTQGNLNNHIGLPMTILGLKDHTAIVVEMGMNNFGEISTLTNIAKPTCCVITNIGTSHIGILGSRENILKAKLEILEGLMKNGNIIINNDNDLLNKWYEENKDNYNITTCGIHTNSDILATDVKVLENGSEFKIKLEAKEHKIKVPVAGEHFVINSLCAIAVGMANNIKMEDVICGIEGFELTKRRMEISKNSKGTIIINDTYNASYDSMKAAIKCLANMNGNKKIALLGDMFELGEYEEELHRKVGEEVAKNSVDILVTVGNAAKFIADEASKLNMKKENIIECNSREEAVELVNKIAEKDDIILVKASNGMKFDKIIEKIIN